MTTPINPASVFGRRRSPTTPESPSSPTPYEVTVIPAEPEKTADESVKATVINNELGNPELPIAAYREQIVKAVDASQATVITAETGAGKSTQVPQFLAEHGYEVIVTQPRVVAARSVAERVSDEVTAKFGPDFKEFVGYRTARERGDSDANQILFVTDGLQLVRELSGNGVGKKQALVLDEVHEWNENMEVLVAWAKQRMAEDPNFKVVTMSATMEADKLSKYFADDGKREVPVVEVPGRTFEVKKSEGGDVADQAIKMAQAGKNTLVFVPGKAEIDQVIAALERANIAGATILPLHGQMEKEDQRKVFKKYPGVKVIVATNVARTSITIDDIDAVVDSGLERQNQVKNGVEGLYLNPISQADCLQRAGRAGRTKEGEYVLAQLGNNPFVAMKDREPYGTPEIMRTRLDGMVLRLAKSGFDAAGMEFYHQPEHGEIAKAKERLQKLGALREDGSITKIGRDMDRMPVESHYARMMIEARNYSPEVQMQLAALLAVQEADGICQFSTRNRYCDERWRGLLAPDMNDSDLIKQLEVFVAAQSMSDTEKRNHDIYMKAFSKAREVLRQLRGVEGLKDQNLTAPTTEQREQLLRCIVAGMVDNLYVSQYGDYSDARGNRRDASTKRIVRPNGMIVGTPFDLEINTRRGNSTLHLIEGITNVPSVEMLRDVAPQLFSERHDRLAMSVDGEVVEYYTVVFNGQNTGETISRPAPEGDDRRDYLVRTVADRYWRSNDVAAAIRVVSDLNNRMPGSVGVVTNEDIQRVMREAMPLSVATLSEAQTYVPEFSLDDLVTSAERDAIYAVRPDEVQGVKIEYYEGQPRIARYTSEDIVLALDPEAMVLPDGLPVMASDGWSAVQTVAERQQAIANLRAERAEQERKKHEENVQKALGHLSGGYDLTQIRSWYGEEVMLEAQRIHDAQQLEKAIAAEEAAKRRAVEQAERVANQESMRQQVAVLLRRNDDMYKQTKLAGLDDAPEEIRNGIYDIQDELDTMQESLQSDEKMIGWGHEVALGTYNEQLTSLAERLATLTAQFTAWYEEQKSQAGKPASAEDLAALMKKFNNH